ncbi:phosphate ABC transporter substrate-binding protein PstS family protein [Ligilactobacillus faecis]|uniref:phosphate ABC transporter substrate-binding protein PstS family protein n=1 Tax=Ligilactobacillus faecis TaxID=762833 RepID=UPI0024684DF5|nr:phosphate ABC transporter substrate-binding protein PstS family protein [Ligilactobacillus faecis]WGN89677.1 phosphate ABC transporter substrate-binding protein PstS family protein [Ligilactobacillus faecis]
MKKAIIIFSTLVLAFILTGCGQKTSQKQNITIVGSTALQPMVELAAEEYQRDHTDVTITVQGGGSGTGLSQVQAGAVTIGNSDVFASEMPGIKVNELVDHKVAVLGLAPVVNKESGVTDLTMKQLRDVFRGKYTNWKQLGGKNVPIVLINRAEGSGTRRAFEKSVMVGQKMAKAQEQDSNGTVQRMVTSTPGAISYLAFSYMNKDMTSLKINGVKPTAANVKDNSWKIWAYEHMYTKGRPNKQAKQFLEYMNSDLVQDKLVKTLGYIPINEMQVTKDENDKVISQTEVEK